MEGNQKKKLLYIMGIDWNWIFQRPQILALHLEEKYDVTVVFPGSIIHRCRKKENLPKKYRILRVFPWQEKIKAIGWVSACFAKGIFCDIDCYDIVMVGYPLFYRYIPASYQGRIIYDCMDNHEALYPYRKGVGALLQQEERLAKTCDALITTGIGLYQKMRTLSDMDKVTLIRNGVSCDKAYAPLSIRPHMPYKIGYFGTISAWFDFEVLLKSLQEMPEIEYHLIGPIHGVSAMKHSRIFMEGTIEHSQLGNITREYACFVMPFIVDETVRYVDPVKLYEYISFGKCIISIRYLEVERFNDYVYLYSTPEEYMQLLRGLKEKGFPPKYSRLQQMAFLEENSWKNRFRQLDRIMSEL